MGYARDSHCQATSSLLQSPPDRPTPISSSLSHIDMVQWMTPRNEPMVQQKTAHGDDAHYTTMAAPQLPDMENSTFEQAPSKHPCTRMGFLTTKAAFLLGQARTNGLTPGLHSSQPKNLNILHAATQTKESVSSSNKSSRFHCKAPGCVKVYRTKRNLTRHMKTQFRKSHSSFDVPNCCRGFRRCDILREHYRGVHAQLHARG